MVRMHNGGGWQVAGVLCGGEEGDEKDGVSRIIGLWTNSMNRNVWRYATNSARFVFPKPTSSASMHPWIRMSW